MRCSKGELFEGEGAWASGYQYRKIYLESELDDLTNVDRTPVPLMASGSVTRTPG